MGRKSQSTITQQISAAARKSKKTRGLAATITAEAPPPPAGAEARTVPFGSLFPSPLNPRKSVGGDAALQPLCDSIVANGLLEPLLVRPKVVARGTREEGDRAATVAYEIIAGERRWRAIGLGIKLGWLPAEILVDVRVRAATDAELVELAATENMGREDMHPLDEAMAIAAMRQFHKEDGNIARRLGIPERTLYRRVALLRLVPELQADLRAGGITLNQASAFSLGTPAAQRQHREQIARSVQGEYYKDPAVIRRAMVEKRVPVKRAVFALADYTGEYLDDPDTGDRYFVDLEEFKVLQAAAIEAKIKALKDARWSFVKKIESWLQHSFAKAKKGEKGAGAIYWLDADGTFHTREGVLDPNAKRAAEREDDEAPGVEDDAPDEAIAEDAADPELEAAEARDEKLAATIRANPHAALALAVMRAFTAFAWYECSGEAPAPRNQAVLDLALPLLRPLVIGDIEGEPDQSTLLEAIEDVDWQRHVGLYRVLADMSVEALLQLLAAAGEGWSLLQDFKGLNELGMLVMQHELPLAPPAPEPDDIERAIEDAAE